MGGSFRCWGVETTSAKHHDDHEAFKGVVIFVIVVIVVNDTYTGQLGSHNRANRKPFACINGTNWRTASAA